MSTPKQNTSSSLKLISYVELALMALYLLVHFIADNDAIDVMGPHWFYVAVIDGIILVYLLLNRKTYGEQLSAVLSSPLTIVYGLLFIWAGGSYFYAINSNEMVVCFARMATTLLAFINISVFLRNREDYFNILATMFLVVLSWESISVINKFLDGINSANIDEVILAASGNTGNKNIIAASIAIKIPFAIYFLHARKYFIQLIAAGLLFLAFYALFILNARATFVGMGLLTIIYLIYLFISDPSKENRFNKFKPFGYYIFCLVASLMLSVVVFKNIKENNEALGGYDDPLKRIGTIALTQEGSGRTNLWGFAFDYFKHHPIVGAGYGNWKLASIPYEKFYSPDYIVAYHCHNDFLETSAELGIIGLALYLSIYLVIFFTQMKRIINKSTTSQQKLIAAIGIFCLTAYFIDATFNFPVERTIMQVNFAFMAALIFIIPLGESKTKKWDTTFYFLPALLFAALSIMINNQVFDSMKGQKLFSGDMDKDIAQIPDLEYDFPTYPQLSYNSIPIDAIMSRYAFKKNDYETAIRMLDKASKQNPYIHYSEFAKAGMYYKMNQPDSGYKYAKLAFEYKPLSFSAYKNWLYGSVQKRDTTSIDSAFYLYKKYRNEPNAWTEYFNACMVVKQRADQKLIALADSALKYFPDSVNLFTTIKNNFIASRNNPVRNAPIVSQEMVQLAQKNLEQATLHFNQKQYALAAKEYLVTANIDVTNFVHLENVAICYYSLGDYNQSIKYFNKAINVSGGNASKSFYYRGVSEVSIGKKDQGCASIKTAISKGFQGDVNYNKTNCNF